MSRKLQPQRLARQVARGYLVEPPPLSDSSLLADRVPQITLDPLRSPDEAGAIARPSCAMWVALAVLTLINLLNYVDRYIVPALGESLEHSALHLGDTQFGFLASAFLIVYMVAAWPFGALGDRRARPPVIAIGIALWSIATALGGVAWSYGSLLAARAAVGIGEAAYAAIAPALLADYFPERLRGRVFAIFFAATPVGSALGYVVGGVVDHLAGWRAAFFVAGIPGLVLAALALRLPEPRRAARAAATQRVARWANGSARSYLTLARNGQYLLTILGYAAYTFAIGGIAVWMPTFLERVRGLSQAEAPVKLGAVLVVTGFAGTFAGGWVGDSVLRYTRRAYLWVSGIATLAAVPFAYLALASPTPRVYWTALVIAEVLVFISTGPINSAIVSEVAPSVRASAMAMCIFTIHVLGDVPSPTVIGALSEATSLGRAVMVIPVAITVGAVIWLVAAARRVREPAGASM